MTAEDQTRPFRQIRALYDANTVTVYQAYRAEIAVPAARDGRFPAAFKRARMTWIKPSFLWMMYRSGWGTKPDQEHVLAIRLDRIGFETALAHASLSDTPGGGRDERTPVRVQWDPERDLALRPLPYRAIQIGVSGPLVDSYCDAWVQGITDVTDLARAVHAAARAGDVSAAARLLPDERPYPVDAPLSALLGMTPGS